jgi:hypothetical protein
VSYDIDNPSSDHVGHGPRVFCPLKQKDADEEKWKAFSPLLLSKPNIKSKKDIELSHRARRWHPIRLRYC